MVEDDGPMAAWSRGDLQAFNLKDNKHHVRKCFVYGLSHGRIVLGPHYMVRFCFSVCPCSKLLLIVVIIYWPFIWVWGEVMVATDSLNVVQRI
jgi:hypothetical protein